MDGSDQAPESDGLWYKDAIIYELPVKAFYDSNGDGTGDFKGLTAKLGYLRDLGITALWLLPFYPSPQKDDGYDISDYCDFNPKNGDLNDFKAFLNEAHKQGIRVITELVLNHTSDQHEWFQRSRRGGPDSSARRLYVWSDTPDKFKDARIIFKDFERSNWTWDEEAKAYFWHRFYAHQPDLNYDNEEVQQKILEVVDFWLGLGVDGLRLDAVPYLYEREGTNCENLPETHAFLKGLRAHVDGNFKGRMLLAEANQWPTDAVAYFGDGDESHMAFHFPLMPRIFMSIDLEDRFPITDILESTPPIPENAQWALFLRNHDELTLEMVTDEERDYMYRVYARDKQARINLGIRRRLAPLLKNDRRKIELVNVLLFTLPGTPVLYYGDEIGMGDDYHLGDRNGVRTPMQWDETPNSGFSTANPQKLYLPVITDTEYNYEAVNVDNQIKNQSSLFWWTKKMIGIRKYFKAFGRGDIEFAFPENNKILAYYRRYGSEVLFVAVNLSKRRQVAELDMSKYEGYFPTEVSGGTVFPRIGRSEYILTFDPFGYYIFSLTRQVPTQPFRILSKQEVVLEKDFDELFEGDNEDKLESEILPHYLNNNNWFGLKGKDIDYVKLRDMLPIAVPGTPFSRILIVDIYYQEGLPDSYVLPVVYSTEESVRALVAQVPHAIIVKTVMGNERGILYDGMHDDAFRGALLDVVANRRVVKGLKGELRGTPRESFRGVLDAQLVMETGLLNAGQGNTTVFYNNKAVLKLFRRVEEGINPDVEVGDFLTNASFAHSPTILGDISYHERGAEQSNIAVLQCFVKNDGDAWALCLREVKRYYERKLLLKDLAEVTLPAHFVFSTRSSIPDQMVGLIGAPFLDLIRLLGVRTGELHKTLMSGAAAPEFAPESFNYLSLFALSQSMASYARRTLQWAMSSKSLGKECCKEVQFLVKNRALIEDAFKALRQEKIDSLKIRIHGDYHLQHILFSGCDFTIIDFEGEPTRPISERRLKRSPLMDVACMIRSFHYAALAGLREMPIDPATALSLERWGDLWYKCCASAFLVAYIQTVNGTGIIPSSEASFKTLLNAFLLEKSIYELAYELNNRPAWASIPLRGIYDLLGV